MAELQVPLTIARRMAITRQHLAGPRPAPTRERMLEVVKDLGYLQLDPINVVARSHLLVLWSRLGPYDRAELQALRWDDRAVFEYWAHGASIVPTEDYPLHHLRMRSYPTDRWAHGRRTRAWLEENTGLRRHVLSRLRRQGPLRLRDFEDRSVVGWTSAGWTSGRNVERMLDVLWTQGKIVVSGRIGQDRVWDLADRWFPAWTPRDRLSEREITRRITQRSLRALGVATAKQVQDHISVGRPPGFAAMMAELEKAGRILPVRLSDGDKVLAGRWFVHTEDLPILDRLIEGEWEPRTTLLSPFDNLITDRARTETMFGVRFRMEIYVPKHLRQFGYYVLPILHGDRLIGRVDPLTDRKGRVLRIGAVYAEPDGPRGRTAARAIREAIESVARFVDTDGVDFAGPIDERWSPWLG